MVRARTGGLVIAITGAVCVLAVAPSGAAVPESDWVEVPHGRPPNQYTAFADAWTTGDELWAVGMRRVTLPDSFEDHNWVQRCVAGVCSPTHPDEFESPPYTENVLTSISGTSSTDVWAVGYARRPDGVEGATTHHFDGASWTVVPNPVTNGFLNSVSAAAVDDVWAVGADNDAADDVVLRWDGSTWSRMPFELDGPCAPDSLNAVDVTGRFPLVVGRCRNGIRQPRAMIASYRNGSWHRMHVDGIDLRDTFNSISWVDKQAWAVGYQAGGEHALAARWKKGDGWDAVDTADIQGVLTSAAGDRTNDAWLVGYNGCCGALALHWNGRSLMPDDVGTDAGFSGVAVSPDGTVWGVGSEVVGQDHNQSLIMKRGPS